jgi:hypothetical protein
LAKGVSQKAAIKEKTKIFKTYLPQRAPRPQRDFGSWKDRKMLTPNKYALSVKVKSLSFFGSNISVLSVTSVAKQVRFGMFFALKFGDCHRR